MSVAPIWSLFAVSDRASAVISKFRTAANAVLMVLQCLLMSAQTFCNFEEPEMALATAASAEHPFFTRSAVRRDSAKKDAYLIKDCSQCRLFLYVGLLHLLLLRHCEHCLHFRFIGTRSCALSSEDNSSKTALTSLPPPPTMPFPFNCLLPAAAAASFTDTDDE